MFHAPNPTLAEEATMFRSPTARTHTTLRPRHLERRPQVESLEGRALLAAGALDSTFGGTGQVTTQLSQSLFAQGVAVQADLKTLVVGLEAADASGGLY